MEEKMKKLQSEQEFYKSLGLWMHKIRRRSKLSPFHAGRQIGVHGIAYYEMEKGRIAPTPYQVYRVIQMWAPELLRYWK